MSFYRYLLYRCPTENTQTSERNDILNQIKIKLVNNRVINNGTTPSNDVCGSRQKNVKLLLETCVQLINNTNLFEIKHMTR